MFPVRVPKYRRERFGHAARGYNNLQVIPSNCMQSTAFRFGIVWPVEPSMSLPLEFTVQTCAPMFFTLITCPVMGLTGSVIVTSPPAVSQRIVKSSMVAVYALFLVAIAITTVPREKSLVLFQ